MIIEYIEILDKNGFNYFLDNKKIDEYYINFNNEYDFLYNYDFNLKTSQEMIDMTKLIILYTNIVLYKHEIINEQFKQIFFTLPNNFKKSEFYRIVELLSEQYRKLIKYLETENGKTLFKINHSKYYVFSSEIGELLCLCYKLISDKENYDFICKDCLEWNSGITFIRKLESFYDDENQKAIITSLIGMLNVYYFFEFSLFLNEFYNQNEIFEELFFFIDYALNYLFNNDRVRFNILKQKIIRFLDKNKSMLSKDNYNKGFEIIEKNE